MKNDSSIQNVYTDIRKDLSVNCFDVQSPGKFDTVNFRTDEKFIHKKKLKSLNVILFGVK